MQFTFFHLMPYPELPDESVRKVAAALLEAVASVARKGDT